MTHAQARDVGRAWIIPVLGIALLQSMLAAPTRVEALGQLLFVHEDDAEVPINCSNAVMTTAPTFLAAPKGAAKYPFSMRCTSPVRPGLMTFTWEGSWTPSETRRDRPNASESLTVTGYEPFLPGRAPGGKIFMYWTGSCTGDPWLQGGTCSRFGEYMPDDLRAAFPNVGRRPFPITGNSVSPTLKQYLVKQYQEVNQQTASAQNQQRQVQQAIVQQPSQALSRSQRSQAVTVQPQIALPKPKSSASALSRSGIFARGVESDKSQQDDRQADTPAELVETSAMATLEEGLPEPSDPVALTLDRPIHVLAVSGEPVVLTPGAYDVQPVLDVQLGFAKEGQRTVLVNAARGTHDEALSRNLVVAIPGPSDDVHIVMLMTDGRRFDMEGSTAKKHSAATAIISAITDDKLRQAIDRASVQSRAASPACQANPADTGPRWIPVPCTMPTPASGGTP